MKQDRWRRVEAIYHEALERDGVARAVYLEQACDGDGDLRREVESLLSEGDGGGILDGQALEVAGDLLDESQEPTLEPGAVLGPYKVEQLLGAGGMGVVYRARDTRLGRTVALKLMRGAGSASAAQRQRFLREAKAISALSHPNICGLHDIGTHAGLDYLVMEHVSGETLATRLKLGALPLEEALRYGAQIADALAAAHARGIVHRDLKPANAILTSTGIKLLDFGLAKLAPEPRDPGATETASGVVMGTPAYMSPEQLEGRGADGRSDIFALGLVLYEMVSGRRAFQGDSQASITAAILREDPAPLGAAAPPHLEHLVARCLAKDTEQRWQSARDLASELRWIAAKQPQESQPVATSGRTWRLAWGAALVVFAAAVGGWALRRGPTTGQAPIPGIVRFRLDPPVGRDWVALGTSDIAVSPDGRQLAMSVEVEGKRHIWIREIGSLAAQRLDDTAGAVRPFWSPDGQQVAFAAHGQLNRISRSGGSALSICSVNSLDGGAWSSDGTILFAEGTGPIYQVPASGGVPKAVTALASDELGHTNPQPLPDGKHFLFGCNKPGNLLGAVTCIQGLGSNERSRYDGQGIVGARYVEPGYLLFIEGRTLYAQRFDTRTFQLSGGRSQLAANLRGSFTRGSFTASANGVLVYQFGTARESQPVWYDRTGRRLAAVGSPGRYQQIVLSPDDKRLAVDRREGTLRGVWIIDLMTGVSSLAASEPGWQILDPVWSPDGKRLAVAANRVGRGQVRSIDLTSGASRVLRDASGPQFVEAWSPDGRTLLFRDTFRLFTLEGEGEPSVVVVPALGRRGVDQMQWSPDGRWLAFHSEDVTARRHVSMTAYPSMQERRQVSSAGGGQPMWRRDGKELFYVSTDGMLMAVDVTSSGSAIETGAPRPLFRTSLFLPSWNQYAVTRDGSRFLVLDPVGDVDAEVAVVLNWTAGLGQ